MVKVESDGVATIEVLDNRGQAQISGTFKVRIGQELKVNLILPEVSEEDIEKPKKKKN